ncbi:hypothetical protein OXX80_003825 [Metschnikowia pulcherrima]
MSRPVSAEELISSGSNNGKPRFLSRKKRSQLKQEAKQESLIIPKTVKKVQEIDEISHEPEHKSMQQSSEPKRRKTQNGKYAFSWDSDDDTSGSYQPLVVLESETKTVDVVSKEVHWSQKPLDEMTVRDWRIFKDDFNISSKGKDINQPLRNWAEEELLPQSLQDILCKKLKYTEPTPIQRAAIPLALRNRDVVGIAETGSGKTLAFLLPILSYLLGIEKAYMEREHPLEANHNKTLALILAPTRELALQITKEAEKFTSLLGYSVVTIIGGHQYEESVHSLRNGVHIIVATPGRLVDSLERGIVSLEKCYHLTMDEADKMIDMGFEKSLQKILSFLPTSEHLQSTLDCRIFRVQKRATLMFTATISPAIEKITKNYLVSPGFLFVGGANESVDNIKQNFEYLGPAPADKQVLDMKRVGKLIKLLESHRKHREFSVIIFANYKRVVESLADELLENKKFDSIAVIHGSKSQESRERAIEAFRSKEASILIATDVAARGLDVPHVSMVVNFQMSNKFEEYIHRIGRTGRAGQQGESHTYIDDGDRETFADLKKFLKKGGYRIPDWLYRA